MLSPAEKKRFLAVTKIEKFAPIKHECVKCGTKGMFNSPKWIEDFDVLSVECMACGYKYYTETKDAQRTTT